MKTVNMDAGGKFQQMPAEESVCCQVTVTCAMTDKQTGTDMRHESKHVIIVSKCATV